MALKLGKTREELVNTMTPTEFKQWVAYFSLQDEEYKKDLEYKVSIEEQQNQSQEELAQQMRAMLLGLKG